MPLEPLLVYFTIGKNNISPLPNNFSAPDISNIVLESTLLVTANEIRDGMLL